MGHVIGKIRRTSAGHRAKCLEEDLGVYPNGDAAATAIWRRYIEVSETRHAGASVTHGAYERHVRATL